MKKIVTYIEILTIMLSFSVIGYADSAILPNNLIEIAEEAFFRDKSLINAAIYNGTKTIGPKAFAFSGLQRIFLPESVNNIDSTAFYGLSSNFTIYAPKDSDSHHFAVDNNYHWVDSTYDTFVLYLSESQRITDEYNSSYITLCEELTSLQDSKAEADNAVIQAELDLEKLPREKEAFISNRTYYYMNNGSPSSYAARTAAERDWEVYYKMKRSSLNSTIITNTAASEELAAQIEEKQSDIESLTNNYNQSISELWEGYPNTNV